MPPTTSFRRGDVVLVDFAFSGETGVKRRPALVVSSEVYHRARQETVIAAVTSNVERLLVGDHLVSNWQQAGLLYPSVVTGIIRTMKQTMVARRLGSLSGTDMKAVDRSLSLILGPGRVPSP
jgi:mRNA interferase MazF